MSADTAIYIFGAVMIAGAFAMTAFVMHLADVAKKEREIKRKRKRAEHHPD